MNKVEKNLITIMLFFHIISWVFFMPFAQIQMLLFGKRIISFVHYGIVELLIIFILFIKKRGKIKIKKIDKNSLFVIVALLISWIFNISKMDNLNSYIILFYLMCWIVPFLIIITVDQYEYDIKKLLKLLLFVVTIHSIIILYQRLANTIFWPYITYEDGTRLFAIDSYYNVGKMVRCPGICVSGLEAGILLIFGFVLTFIIDNNNKITKIFLRLLFIIALFFTGTRNIYIMFLYIIVVSLLMKQNISTKGKTYLLIIFTLFTCICYFYLITSISSFNTTKNLLTDTTSIGIRLKKWSYVFDDVFNGGLDRILFGFMKWENAGNSIIIDNMFLELLHCSGIIPLLLYIKTIISLSITESEASNYKSFLCSGFTLCYFVYGIMNSSSNLFLTLIIILYIYCCNMNKYSGDKMK